MVSDVVRTLTDKTTADLLHNKVAQRQLKMDRGVNSVTIVCTKTDVLTVDKIAGSSLDPNRELKNLSDEIREQEAKIRKLETQLFALEGKQDRHLKHASDRDRQQLRTRKAPEDVFALRGRGRKGAAAF